MFQFRWLRALIRRNTSPIPHERAHIWKQRLSIAYALFAWNAFGFVLYNIFKGNADWAKDYKTEEELALTPAQSWAKTLGIKQAKVYKISGLNVSSYEINEDGEEDKAE